MRDTAEGATLRVRVVPRAGREEIVGARGGALVVRLSVPPVEGQANRALIALLARAAGRPPSSVSLIQGAGRREKVVRFAALTAHDLLARLQVRR